MLERLYELRKVKDKLDAQLKGVINEVMKKEHYIQMKENEKSNMLEQIENERIAHDQEFAAQRKKLFDQGQLIQTQRNELNKLQTLNEYS